MIKEIKTKGDVHILLGYFAGTIRGIMDYYPIDEALKKKLLELCDKINKMEVNI